MSSNLKVNTILPSAGSNIGLGTNGGNLNVDGGCKVQVGTALTLGHSIGLQFATQNLHSAGFEINQINASGIITATTFSGSGASLTNLPAGNLTGTVADARISTLTASKLTGALPAISGANLTGVSAGKILQVKTLSWLAGGVSGSGDTFHGVTSGNLQITPSAANSKILLILTGVNGHANMGGSTGNHGCRYFFGMSINGGSFVSVTTGNAFNTSDEEPLSATHINGDVGTWLDFPIDYSYVVTPSYSLGQAIDFRPYYGKNYSMGNSFSYYFQHDTQATKGNHRSNFTIMEISA